MTIEPNKLRCDAEGLKKIISILKKIKSGLVRVEAKGHQMTLLTRLTHDKWHHEVKNPSYAMIKIPYLGEDFDMVLIDLKDLPEKWLRWKGDRPEWEKEYPISYKRHKKVAFKPGDLARALDYLLRTGPCEKSSRYTGIAFKKLEVSSTNSHNLHICTGLPMLSETHAMLSLEAGAALLQAIRKMDFEKVEGLYKPGKMQPTRGSFVFIAKSDDDIEVQIGSFPTEEVGEYNKARLPIDDRRASVAVHQSFLEEICRYTVKVCPAAESPIISFRFQPQRYIYEIESSRYSAEMPLWDWRAEGMEELECMIDAANLLKAIRGLGNVVQIIFPFHPMDGLKYHSYNPIYINGDARDRFAILAQCGDEQEAMRINAERDGALQCPSNYSTG